MRKLALLLVLLPISAFAQCSTHARHASQPWTWLKSNECPDDYQKWVAPRLKDRWYKDKYLWIGIGAIGAGIAADAITTSNALHNPGLQESNPLLGKHPSDGKIAGISAGFFALDSALHLAEWKLSHNDPNEAWRVAGRLAVPAAVDFSHGYYAIHNINLLRKVEKVQHD